MKALGIKIFLNNIGEIDNSNEDNFQHSTCQRKRSGATFNQKMKGGEAFQSAKRCSISWYDTLSTL
jgi:hypothetical protein